MKNANRQGESTERRRRKPKMRIAESRSKQITFFFKPCNDDPPNSTPVDDPHEEVKADDRMKSPDDQ